jgi:hypothetical protein
MKCLFLLSARNKMKPILSVKIKTFGQNYMQQIHIRQGYDVNSERTQESPRLTPQDLLPQFIKKKNLEPHE